MSDCDSIVAPRDSVRRRIWLCADDYGISPAVSAAIRDLIGRRRINATSVMVVAPSFRPAEAADLIDAAGRHAAIGLHLTLTAPFAPLSDGFAPLREGVFLPLAAMAGRALAHNLAPERVGDGDRSSIGAPSKPHSVARPTMSTATSTSTSFRKSARCFCVRSKRPHRRRGCGNADGSRRRRKRLGDPKALFLDRLSRSFRNLARDEAVPTNPAFAGTYAFRQGADFARLFPNFLEGLPDGGVVMCHPGIVDAELRRLDPLTDLREREYAFLLSEAFPELLAAHGVSLK